MLVDHALARFSTDNLSVMVVRFDSQKLQSNSASNIGVETEDTKEKGAVSEVEMIVSEARRNSGILEEGAVDDEDSEDVRQTVIKEAAAAEEEEDQEPGPELTPEGKQEADKILADKQRESKSESGS